MSRQQIPTDAAKFAIAIAESVVSLEREHGDWHLMTMRLGLAGEPTSYLLVPNEHGDYDLAIDEEAER